MGIATKLIVRIKYCLLTRSQIYIVKGSYPVLKNPIRHWFAIRGTRLKNADAEKETIEAKYFDV
jgi:hypothetical protein